jgi:hypothetical protein
VKARWRAVKALVDQRLKNVKYFNVGYRRTTRDSLENGAVALTMVGESPSGRLFALYAITNWT